MFPLVLCLYTTKKESFHCKFAVYGIEKAVELFYIIYLMEVDYIVIFLFGKAGDIENSRS